MLLTRSSALFGLLAPVGLFAACISSTSSTGTTGSTAGGTGGILECTDGVTVTSGPATTTATTATATVGSGGSGGGGGGTGGSGGSGCIGPMGTGQTVSACDALPLAVEKGMCDDPMGGMDMNPPGYTVCVAANDLYTPGAWEALLACLGMIGQANYCDLTEVQTCITQVSASLCDSPSNDSLCMMLQGPCEGDMPPQEFALDTCETALLPWGETAIGDITSCFAAQSMSGSCQGAFDSCVQMELTL
jgi:hypothetical protein